MSRWRIVAPMEHHRSMIAAGLRVRLVVTTSDGWPGWRWDVWAGGGPGQSVVYGAHIMGTSRLIADLLPLPEAKAAAMEWAARFGAELAQRLTRGAPVVPCEGPGASHATPRTAPPGRSSSGGAYFDEGRRR